MILPVMISSLALPSPTIAGSREQPPTSGISPTLTSMIPATASSAIVRKSQASASSNAPPSAAPWIWQIVGFGISSSRFHQARIGRRKRRSRPGVSDSSRRSFRSIPDENIAPSPRTTRTLTESSSAASSIAAPSARISSPLSALRFSGRLSTRYLTAPRSSIWRSPIAPPPYRGPGVARRGRSADAQRGRAGPEAALVGARRDPSAHPRPHAEANDAAPAGAPRPGTHARAADRHARAPEATSADVPDAHLEQAGAAAVQEAARRNDHAPQQPDPPGRPRSDVSALVDRCHPPELGPAAREAARRQSGRVRRVLESL